MSVARNDRIEILEYLKESVRRVRETAWMQPIESRTEILRIVDQIAADTAQLESQLVASGYLPETSLKHIGVPRARLQKLRLVKSLRFNVRRDRDAIGRPEGWFVEDSENKSVLGRFQFRKDAQAMADQANALVTGASKERNEL